MYISHSSSVLHIHRLQWCTIHTTYFPHCTTIKYYIGWLAPIRQLYIQSAWRGSIMISERKGNHCMEWIG